MRLIGIAISMGVWALTAWADGADAILGKWYTHKGDAQFEFTKRDGKYYGHICWEKKSVYGKKDKEAGRTTHDRNNPDPALRARPMLGLELFKDFEYTGENFFDKGTIYNPEDGRTYKANLTLADSEHLKVHGYIGISLIGGTTIWTRHVPPPRAHSDDDDDDETPAKPTPNDR